MVQYENGIRGGLFLNPERSKSHAAFPNPYGCLPGAENQ